MPTLKKFQTFESTAHPGVRFKVRTLNVIERAKRDAAIAEHRIEYSRISIELDTLQKKLIGEEETEFTSALRKEVQKLNLPLEHPVTRGLARWCSSQEVEERFQRLPQVEWAKFDALQAKQKLIHDQFMIPATITAALVAVEGLTVDGHDVSVQDVLEYAPDTLLDEITKACVGASGLIEADSKN